MIAQNYLPSFSNRFSLPGPKTRLSQFAPQIGPKGPHSAEGRAGRRPGEASLPSVCSLGWHQMEGVEERNTWHLGTDKRTDGRTDGNNMTEGHDLTTDKAEGRAIAGVWGSHPPKLQPTVVCCEATAKGGCSSYWTTTLVRTLAQEGGGRVRGVPPLHTTVCREVGSVFGGSLLP